MFHRGRTQNSQSREPRFESSFCHFVVSAILFYLCCPSSLSCCGACMYAVLCIEYHLLCNFIVVEIYPIQVNHALLVCSWSYGILLWEIFTVGEYYYTYLNFFLQKSEITMEVGGPRSHSDFFVLLGKSSQNSPKPVLTFWSSIPCVFCLYIAKRCWLL